MKENLISQSDRQIIRLKEMLNSKEWDLKKVIINGEVFYRMYNIASGLTQTLTKFQIEYLKK